MHERMHAHTHSLQINFNQIGGVSQCFQADTANRWETNVKLQTGINQSQIYIKNTHSKGTES